MVVDLANPVPMLYSVVPPPAVPDSRSDVPFLATPERLSAEEFADLPPGWESQGRIVGRYCVIDRVRPIGSDPDAPFTYALKQPRLECRNDPIVRQLMAREAMAGQFVRNPHVVPVLAAKIVGDQPYLVLPWLPGRTLQHLFDSGQSFSTAEAVWIVRQAACGLGALADCRFTHNDIKPSNLVISDDGHVTLIDLGFASRFDATTPSGSKERSSLLLGSPAYQPPERMASAGDVLASDIRSDMFSLGLVLAELLLSGNQVIEPPARNGAERAEELLHRLRAVVGLPRGLTALIIQMLARHPWRRPDGYSELIRRLTDIEIATFTSRGW